MPQYSFQVPSTSKVFYGPSQRFGTTFNTPPSAYNVPPLSSYYRPSLSTQMRHMGYEDEEEDDNNNNTNHNNDDDDKGGDHVPQQQHKITRDHPTLLQNVDLTSLS